MLKTQSTTSKVLNFNSSSVQFDLIVDPALTNLIGLNGSSTRKVVHSFGPTTYSSSQTQGTSDKISSLSSFSGSNPSDADHFSTSVTVLDKTLTVTDAASADALFDLGASSLGSTTAKTFTDTVRASTYDPIDYGDPLTDSIYWRKQAGSSSCAVIAQISVYESLTGYRVSETAACNYAESQGWFSPQTGTSIPNIGKILTAFGVATYGGYNPTLNQLAYALSKGDKPIVTLDANEIWYPKRDRYGNPIEQYNACHAIWVTGIDIKPNNSINVILNDSGTSYGKSEVVSYTDFYNAWRDYSFQIVVADNPFT